MTPLCVPIRGGTDGARLSWDGLPCPNLSTGGYNFHGVREWIPAASLDAMAAVLADLVSRLRASKSQRLAAPVWIIG